MFINHVNFSGMNLDFEHMMGLLKIWTNCHFMVGIHLNNNGIALNTNYFKEVMELFDIREADLVACNRSKQAEAKGEKPMNNKHQHYHTHLRKYFTLTSPDATNKDIESNSTTPVNTRPITPLSPISPISPASPASPKTGVFGLKGVDEYDNFLHAYKDHLILGKEVKIVEKYKKINDI